MLTPAQAIDQFVTDQATFHALVESLKPWNVLEHLVHNYGHTGDLLESSLKAVTMPGGTLGANGVLRITALWSATNNANNKTPRIRFGGIAGTVFFQTVQNNFTAMRNQLIIGNAGDEASQMGGPKDLLGTGISITGLTTPTIDTTVDQDIVFTAQLANVADTLNLREYLIEYFHAD